MPIHKIQFRQSGGFGGLVRGVDIALETLDASDRKEIERLLRQSGIVEAPAPAAASAAGSGHAAARDLVQYEITIESDTGTAHVRLDDLDLSDRIAPLVAFLQKRARPMPLDRGGT